MFVRLYPDKFRPAPDGRVVILTRPSHAGFGKAKVKARIKAKNYLCKVFDQTFFKKFVGCGVKPHDLHMDAQILGLCRGFRGIAYLWYTKIIRKKQSSERRHRHVFG
jgi:hypothetical protein